MSKRVLAYLPPNDYLRAPRYYTVDMAQAQEQIKIGQSDKNSYYAGIEIINDPAEYPRYGYKECPLNGVKADPELKNLAAVKYEALNASKVKVDDLSEESEASIQAKMMKLINEVEALKEQAAKSDSQIEADNYAEQKVAAVDEALMEAAATEKKKTTKKKTTKKTSS